MARRGVEEKPAWRSVPAPVRREAESALGARVARAQRAWGGYGPSPTFRLRLEDGRRAFFKGVSPQSNPFQHSAHEREVKVYRSLKRFISPWAPEMLASFDISGWRVMLLEDLGPKSAPPWSAALARKVAAGLAEFHTSTLGVELPGWLHRPGQQRGVTGQLWQAQVIPEHIDAVAGLAGAQAGTARRWLTEFVPVLSESACRLLEAPPPVCLAHIDVRSDNLRFVDGRLRLFDWPHVGVGAPEYDAAAFAQTVTVEGGPEPEAVMGWYAERGSVRPDVLTSAVASISGYFANHSWQPDIPGLPRLRKFQRAQLRVTLKWAAARLGLPEPEWADALDVG
jgi:hypothetical protein